jgi:hypothetical protein
VDEIIGVDWGGGLFDEERQVVVFGGGRRCRIPVRTYYLLKTGSRVSGMR